MNKGIKLRLAFLVVGFSLFANQSNDQYLSYPSYGKDIKLSKTRFKKMTNHNLALGLKKWQASLKKNNNSYYYIRSFSSWVGFGQKTLVVVENGKPVLRAFKSFHHHSRNFTPSKYLEKEKDIGSHDKGYKPVLMEMFYKQCRVAMNLPLNKFGLGLRIDDRGVIKTCFSRPLSCVDDCSTSYSVNKLEFGTPSKIVLQKFFE